MENIDKKEALKRLKSIEEETIQLRKIIEKKDDWASIVDFESASIFLGEDSGDVDKWKYAGLTLSQINGLCLERCIKAVNTTNGKLWIPDFSNTNQRKWYNWFEKKSSGWLLYVVVYGFGFAVCGFGFYYETEEKARHGAKYFKQYYNIWLGN